jgi:hypothetical protein
VCNDGSVYDLKAVTETYLQGITTQNFTFFYHPCGDTKELPSFIKENNVTNNCAVGYSLCMYDPKDNKTVVLGNQAHMVMRKDSDTMRAIFMQNPETSEKESSVSFECSPNAKTSILYSPDDKIDVDQVVSKIVT